MAASSSTAAASFGFWYASTVSASAANARSRSRSQRTSLRQGCDVTVLGRLQAVRMPRRASGQLIQLVNIRAGPLPHVLCPVATKPWSSRVRMADSHDAFLTLLDQG